LNGKKEERELIYERFIRIGYDLTQPHYVLYIEVDEVNELKQLNEDRLQQEMALIKNTLFNHFSKDKKQHGQNVILFTMKGNVFQVIVSEQLFERKNMSIKQYAKELLNLVTGKHHAIYVGVGEKTTSIHDFSKLMDEAKKAVELAKFQYNESKVAYTSELGHMSLLLNARKPEQLNQYAYEKLKPLIDYDEHNDSSLLYTLYNYSQNEFNLHKTARKIHISISGMRYRIQKIEELLGKDLADSNFRFEIQLALYTLYMLGKVKSEV